jgi:hypothetical protein
MGKENDKRIFLVKKRFGTMWKLVSVSGTPLILKGTEKAMIVLKRLEDSGK